MVRGRVDWSGLEARGSGSWWVGWWGQARKAIRQEDKQSQCRAGSRLQLGWKAGVWMGCRKARKQASECLSDREKQEHVTKTTAQGLTGPWGSGQVRCRVSWMNEAE